MSEQAIVGSEILPISVGACATLACIWEVTAPKPGNVYRGADFEDVTYADFVTSAVLVGPVLELVSEQGVGVTVRKAVEVTHDAISSNTNLGMLLLLVPLAAVPCEEPLARGIASVLSSLSKEDTCETYAAIRYAQPAGMGKVNQADVNSLSPPNVNLTEAMALAADRDLVAMQYTNDYQQVFEVADRIESNLNNGLPLSGAIVEAYLSFLAKYPDSLISRKCGDAVAEQVSARASDVLAAGRPGDLAYEEQLKSLDFWLCSDGHRLNPGTSADFISAGLFVLLREQRLNWPIQF